jgi:amino acid adenylation domain-containing protein
MKETSFQNKLFDSLAKFNNNTAIEYGSKVLTYADVDSKTNCIANHLKEKGIQPGTFIGILQEDRLNLLLSVIGILKAGCVFITLDTAFPKTRLKSIIRHTGMNYIISHNGWRSKIWHEPGDTGRQGKPTFIHFDRLVSYEGDSRFTSTPDTRYSPEDEIYIYFTSGTSGKPKAIIGKNKSLLHFIEWEIGTFGVEEGYRFSQWIIPGFDAYLRDVFVPLCSGGTCCIPEDPELILKTGRMVEWVRQQRIHLIHCVPSLFRSFNTAALTPGDLTGLKYILLSGEEIRPLDLVDWFNTFGERIQLANLYGPTETTMIKSCYLIREADVKRERIPIGKAIPGSQLVIFDKQMKPCGVGMVGEIYIRTPYRTAGYYKDEELMRLFIPNPLNGKDPNDLLFKTGDLGRLLPDRNIELLGRIDRQIKWHGIRLEPEEIEHLLVKHPLVKEAVVLKQTVSTNNDTELLVAYITGTGQNTPGNESLHDHLKDYLSGQLPVHMVPGKILEIEKMPAKPNGKIDYDALPVLLETETQACVPPANEIEKKLLRIWSEVLKNENFGVTHLLFELGGNSLNVMALISSIHREFNTRLTLGEIFNNPTIQKQARLIEGRRTADRVPANAATQPVETKEYYALSQAQARLYFLQQVNLESTVYNMPFVLGLEGAVEKDKFERIFKRLIQKHESLRTSFIRLKDRTLQRIHREVAFAIEYYDHVEERAKPAVEKIINNFERPFDLSHAPLLRVGLIREEKQKYVLIVEMHHIISDGASIMVFIQEISSLYEGRKLPEPRIQYKDYSEWQNRLIASGKIKKQEEYWLNRFKEPTATLDLPFVSPYPEEVNFKGDGIWIDLGEALSKKTRELVKETNTTLYMVLQAILILLLWKYTGQKQIVIGSPVTARKNLDLQNIIGMFVNLVALKNQIHENKSFLEFLGEVRSNAIEAFDNRDYQFADLVKQLQLPREAGRNPLFDIVFTFTDITDYKMRLKNLKIFNSKHKRELTNFVLHVEGLVNQGRIGLNFSFSTNHFKRSRVEKMLARYLEILEQVVEEREIPLKDIQVSHDLNVSRSGIFQEDGITFEF